jgi:hypothetical protein
LKERKTNQLVLERVTTSDKTSDLYADCVAIGIRVLKNKIPHLVER